METFFLIFVGAAVVMLLILLVMGIKATMARGESESGDWLIKGSLRRIGAVASITIAEGLRMRLAVVFVATLVIAIPLFAIFGSGDGTIKGRLQMFVGYAFGFSSFLLALLTIVLATRSLSSEIAGKQVFGIVTKPTPRWQVVVGKWAGVTTLNIFMLIFATGSAYLGIRYILYTEHAKLQNELVTRGGLSEQQAWACIDAINSVRGPGVAGMESPIIDAMADTLGVERDAAVATLLRLPEETRLNLRRLDELRRHVLVSRASLTASDAETNLDEEVDKIYQQRRQAGELEDFWTAQHWRDEIRTKLETDERKVGPNEVLRREITGGPPPRENADDYLVSVRYKIEGYTWDQGFTDGSRLEEDTMIGWWSVGNPMEENSYLWPPIDPFSGQPEAKPINTFVEFEMPSKVIRPDGSVELYFRNLDPRMVTVYLAKGGLEVLYTAGTFEGNLIRAALIELFPLMMLAAMGVFFSTFCTFPVAALVTLTLYFAGISTGFLYESVGVSNDMMSEYPSTVDLARKWIAHTVLESISLSNISTSDRLIEGRIVLFKEIWHEFWINVLFKCSLFLSFGIFVFRRRELAAVIV